MFTNRLALVAVLVCFATTDLRASEPAPRPGPEAQAFKLSDNAYRVAIAVERRAREFYLHVPTGYDAERPAPLVVSLHGGGGGGKNDMKDTRWTEAGERHGLLTIHPSALDVCLFRDGVAETKAFWMTTGKQATLCADQESYEDTPFLLAAIDWVSQEYTVDPTRVYISGFSNGCGMILQKVLPTMGDVFAAAGCVGSLLIPDYLLGADDPASPQLEGRPIPLFSMLGQEDPHFTPHTGGPVPLDPSSIEGSTFLRASIDELLPLVGMKAGTAWQSVTADQDRGVILNFGAGPAVDRDNAMLRVAIMKGVRHSFPTGKEKQSGIVAAKMLWRFFAPRSL